MKLLLLARIRIPAQGFAFFFGDVSNGSFSDDQTFAKIRAMAGSRTKRHFAAVALMSGSCDFAILQFGLHTICTLSLVQALIWWDCLSDPPWAQDKKVQPQWLHC